MTIWYADYKLAAGNNNAAGLVSIESITPTLDRAFIYPQVLPNYDPGEFKPRGDGLRYLSGYQTVGWQFAGITIAQVRYLQETYCSNSYTGKVTVRTRLDDPDVYANYNAVIYLPKPVEGDFSPKHYAGYTIAFRRLVAL